MKPLNSIYRTLAQLARIQTRCIPFAASWTALQQEMDKLTRLQNV